MSATGSRVRRAHVVPSVSIAKFRRAIAALPADKPRVTPGKWYRTQKEHWLGWLREYHGPGAYGRIHGSRRDARFAYNHIVEVKMLLWLIKAAGVAPALINKARRGAAAASTLCGKSAAVRRHVPWTKLSVALFGIAGGKKRNA